MVNPQGNIQSENSVGENMQKEINGFPRYLITEDGEIYLKANGKPIKPFLNSEGYRCVVLTNGAERKHKRVCRLVAEHFIPNPNNKPVVNHKNLIRDDDRVSNLEWVTVLENNLHGIENNRDNHRGNSTISKEQAHRVCQLLAEGLRSIDIEKLTGVNKHTVNHISSGRTWTDVSSQYTLPKKSTKVSLNTAMWVIKQLESGKSPVEILNESKNTRMTLALIERIKDGSAYAELDRPSTIIP